MKNSSQTPTVSGEPEAYVRYRVEGGQSCPNCRSTRILSDKELQADRQNLAFYLRRRCRQCGAGWVECFFLMGIEMVHAPQAFDPRPEHGEQD